MTYLKSPFNYSGQKYPIIGQILANFPKKESVGIFYDLFCGGGSVFINCHYDRVTINDKLKPLIQFYRHLAMLHFSQVKCNIEQYKVEKDNPESFANLRKLFNFHKDNPYMFFCLVSSCTNNLMRFNKKGEFNQTFGKRTVSDTTYEKLQRYSTVIQNKDVTIYNQDFDSFLDKLNKNDFVYLDPPYLITEAGYNTLWGNEQERRLYAFMAELNKMGVRFALSNVSVHKGVKNESLMEFVEKSKFNVINIVHSYEKVAKKKNAGDTQEIFIMNY